MRVGYGYDIHAFSEDPERPLLLGGVHFPGERGLRGHSDADVIAHACCDAILGGAGLGDMGAWFSDEEPAWEGADSIGMLREVVRRAADAGWTVQNLDCTVVAERPKIAPRRLEIQARLSETVGAPVSVKGKTAEGLGALGNGEGIACWAAALLA